MAENLSLDEFCDQIIKQMADHYELPVEVLSIAASRRLRFVGEFNMEVTKALLERLYRDFVKDLVRLDEPKEN